MIVPARLIQRGEIKTLSLNQSVPLCKALYLDYMGSPEFGPWSLPRSLRALQNNFDKCRLKTVNILEQGSRLTVFYYMSDEEFNKYFEDLMNMRIGRQQTEERTHFALCKNEDKRTTDFWWDIENQVMWSFNSDFMFSLSGYLQCSFKEMDQARAKAQTGG